MSYAIRWWRASSLPMNANRPELHLAVQYAVAGEEVPDRAQVRRWARAAQEMPVTVTVRFVDTAEGRRLNRAFRGKDYATNVLSFVYEDEPVIGDPTKRDHRRKAIPEI